MTHIDWTDSLIIDLPTIDAQHKKLIAISNSLLQAMINGMGQEVLETLFDELRAYTSYHFKDEEDFMRQIDYPGLAEQQTAHAQLAKDVDEFRIKLMNDEVSPNEALDFINGWIVCHIQDMDSKLAEYANNL